MRLNFLVAKSLKEDRRKVAERVRRKYFCQLNRDRGQEAAFLCQQVIGSIGANFRAVAKCGHVLLLQNYYEGVSSLQGQGQMCQGDKINYVVQLLSSSSSGGIIFHVLHAASLYSKRLFITLHCPLACPTDPAANFRSHRKPTQKRSGRKTETASLPFEALQRKESWKPHFIGDKCKAMHSFTTAEETVQNPSSGIMKLKIKPVRSREKSRSSGRKVFPRRSPEPVRPSAAGFLDTEDDNGCNLRPTRARLVIPSFGIARSSYL